MTTQTIRHHPQPFRYHRSCGRVEIAINDQVLSKIQEQANQRNAVKEVCIRWRMSREFEAIQKVIKKHEIHRYSVTQHVALLCQHQISGITLPQQCLRALLAVRQGCCSLQALEANYGTLLKQREQPREERCSGRTSQALQQPSRQGPITVAQPTQVGGLFVMRC